MNVSEDNYKMFKTSKIIVPSRKKSGEKNKINFASCTHDGNNRYQEDRFFAGEIIVNGQRLHVFAIFDGHGGNATSQMCRDNLETVIHLPNGYRIQALDKIAVENKLLGGSTATIIVLYPDGKIEAERVGDSQAFMFPLKKYNKNTKKWEKVNKDGESKELVLGDHSPTCIDEFNRLTKDYPNAGWRIEYVHPRNIMFPRSPFVKINNEWQINKEGGYVKKSVTGDIAAYIFNQNGVGLGTTRTIGDLHMRDCGVISEPDKETLQLKTNTYSVLVIASDGMWDIYTRAEVYAIVNRPDLVGNAEMASEILLNSAMKRGQELYKDNVIDNITVIVVYISLQQNNSFDENSSMEVGSDEVGSDEVGSDEVSSDEVDSDEDDSDEDDSDEVDSDEVSSDEVGSNEVGSNEVSSDEVSSDEVRSN